MSKPSSNPKLCRDCRWMQPNDANPEEATCLHLASTWHLPRSLVTGEQRRAQLTCRIARGAWGTLNEIDLCGPEGKHWEPTEPLGFVDPC